VFNVIEEAANKGYLFEHEHTVSHYRNEELLSPFFDALSWGVSDSLELGRFEKRAAEKARKLLTEEIVPVLSSAQEAAIDEIVKEATLDLKD